MPTIGRLVVDLVAQTASFQRDMESSRKSVQSMERTLGSLKSTAVGTVAGLLTIGTAVRAFRAIADATSEGERAQTKLAGVLRATGHAAGLTAADINALAEEMKGTTLFDDDQVREASAALLTFRSVQGDTFKRAIKDAADLSAVFGQDLQGSTVMLGKALEDPKEGLTALRRVGVIFSATEQEMIRTALAHNDVLRAQTIILHGVEQQVGGTAEEMKGGLSGAVDDVTKAWGDFLKRLGQTESVGGTAQQALKGIAGALSLLTPTDGQAKLEADINDLYGRIQSRYGPLAEALGRPLDTLLDQARQLNSQFGETIPGLGMDETKALEGLVGTYDVLVARHRLNTEATYAESQAAQQAAAAARDQGAAQADAATAAALLADRQSALNALGAQYRDEVAKLTLTGQGYIDYLIAAAGAGKHHADMTADEVRELATLAEALKGQQQYLDDTTAAIRRQERALAKRANALLPYSAEKTKAQTKALEDYYGRLLDAQAKLEEGATAYEAAWKHAAENVEDILAGSIEAVLTGQVSTVRDFFQMILQDIAKVAAQLAALGLINAGMDFVGGLLMGPSGLTGMHAHTGGVVGQDLVLGEPLPSALFAGAPRLHGGMLAADEFPTILQRGESVLTPAQLRAVAGLGGGAGSGGRPQVIVQQTINNNFSAVDAAGMDALIERHGSSIAQQVLRATERSQGYARALGKRVTS